MRTTKETHIKADAYLVFVLLMLSGGYVGAFTYLCKGGVFANAQSANCLLFGISIAEGEWHRALRYFIPVITYLLGCGLSSILRKKINKKEDGKWERMLMLAESLLIVCLALIPPSWPFFLSYIIIAFLSSMQYETFRKAKGLEMSTLFCTAHIRESGSNLAKGFTEHDRFALGNGLLHAIMIMMFILGAILFTLLSRHFAEKAILFDLIVFLAVILLLRQKKKATD